MRIMSFNVLCGGFGKKEWTKRRKLVTERIKQISPDTFGVQEAHKRWMKTLCEALPEYDYVGVGRDDGKDEGEFSPVFYKKADYSVIDSGSFWLSETPAVPSKGWDGACIRICSWAVLEEKATGKRFAQVNTHLDHIGDIARAEGIKLVLAKMKEFDMPVLCTGDFNTYEDSEPYKIMTSDIMGDTKYMAKKTVSGNTFHNFDQESTKNDSPIDFIFASRDSVTVDEYMIVNDEINGRQPSDHYAIYADVNL